MPAEKPTFVVSDVHIGAIREPNEQAFRAFLDFAALEATALVINGDLFDVWVPSQRFVQREYVRVLAKLAELTEQQFPIYFVGGNHDALEYGGSVLRETTGMKLLEDPSRMQLGPFRALLVHGDGIRGDSPEYRKENGILRRLLMVPAVRSAAERLLPVDWLYEHASKWSRVPEIVARQERGEGTGPKPLAPLIEAWARDELLKNPDVDVLLAGHSHLPAWLELEPRRFYINTGDWIEHMTYGVLPGNRERPEIRRWPTQELVLPRQLEAAHSVSS